jgi:raffinose/stachyose/melibiose transport system permease protein
MSTTLSTERGAGVETPPESGPSRAGGGWRRNWLGGAAGWLWLAIVVVPIYWIVITSLKSRTTYYAQNPFAPPTDPTLENYRSVVESDFARYFFNSVVVTLGTVLPAVLVSFMAA